jgi:hypothetical protein
MIRIDTRTVSWLALALAAGFACAEPASAQATRTWVSGVGDDANPCSRTAPCKTFAGAISTTAPGGEINCLDPGGFGALTITKAISIICDYTEGGVLVSGSNGFIINAGASDTIYLSGLDFHGAGTGLNGIRFIAGGALHIQNSSIRSFNGTDAFGVSFRPSGTSTLTITNTTITNNGTAVTGGGILIFPTGATGSARVVLRDVRIHNNGLTGIRVDTVGNTGPGSVLVITDTQIEGSTNGINAIIPAATTSLQVMLTNSVVAQNSNVGVRVDGGTAVMRVGNTTITANGTGVARAGGATMNTYGTNRVDGNTTDGTFTLPAIPQE